MQTQAHNGKAWQPGTGAWLRTASAASGLLLVFFLLLHLAGVALAPLAPQRFEAYAAGLHRSAWLPAAELALLAVALTHLGLSLLRAARNRRAAGNTAALRSRRTGPLAPLAAWPPAARPPAGCCCCCFWRCTWPSCAGPGRRRALSWRR